MRERALPELLQLAEDGVLLEELAKLARLEDGLEEYNMDIPLMSLTETLAEHLADD